MPAFSWTTDVDEAIAEQRSLLDLVKLKTCLPADFQSARGMAIGTSYDKTAKRSFAVAVPFDFQGRYGKVIKGNSVEVDFPYIPGLLVFRVGPAICALLDELIGEVDLLLFDGQGIAHQRGMGLATHIGVLYDKPSIGVTRNNLFGTFNEPPVGRFNRNPITHPRKGDIIGYALSLGDGCDPCYVSPGHLVSVEDSVEITCQVAGENTCFPRPLQKAHAAANSAARKYGKMQRLYGGLR